MPRNKLADSDPRWVARWPITWRILAVNVFALAVLAGSLFYLDSFRARVTADRVSQAATQVQIVAEAVGTVEADERRQLMQRFGQESRTRLRLYGADGSKLIDSWHGSAPTYRLRDPVKEPWTKDIARGLDRLLNAAVGGSRPPRYSPPLRDVVSAWPETQEARSRQSEASRLREAPDGTPFISAASPLPGQADVLLLTANARDVRAMVRAERLTLGIILAATITVSVLLSLFLARTIALPLRRLAHAAKRVRLGRAREVDVPRFAARKDEIGLLARALADMTQALRFRIDATEAFAADVTHELKNPLASLRSAVDSLERVDDPELRKRLLEVLRHDVHRLDRLIVDIAETSRLDAELSRARFERIDVGNMIEQLLTFWEARAAERGVRIAFARPHRGSTNVLGEESRLARVFDNLVDNAISFAPADSLVEIVATSVDDRVVVSVEDEGPGVPKGSREAIFRRFHSVRPVDEAFGSHSGLGLAIARAIVEAHDGRIRAEARHDGRSGARFVIELSRAPA